MLIELPVEYASVKSGPALTLPTFYIVQGDDSILLFVAGDEALLSTRIESVDDKAHFEQYVRPRAYAVSSIGDAMVRGMEMNGIPLVRPNRLDGRQAVCNAIAAPTRRMHRRSVTFKTADPASLQNNSPAGVDYGDVAYTMLDANGVATNDPAACARTQLDFEPHYDQELLGGWLVVPEALIDATGWKVSIIGAPDIPEIVGGNVAFTNETDIGAEGRRRIDMDGRSTTFVPYDPQYHSGKLRLTVKHPAGAVERFHFVAETFR